MTSYDYNLLRQEIRWMTHSQIIALTAVCAEKVIPILQFLALPDTWSLAKSCLEFVWFSAMESNQNADQARQLMQALESVPEWQCEYPDSLPFVVTESLSFSKFALACITATSIEEKADNVGFSLLIEIAEGFDIAIEANPRCDTSQQRIKTEEQSSQLDLVGMLRSQDKLSKETLACLQQEARKISNLFEKTLPTYCYHFVSGLIHTAMTRSKSSGRDG